MKFISTRGLAPDLGFCDSVLAGLASDGGLYLPQQWPQIPSKEIASFANLSFSEIAFAIISRFVDNEIDEKTLQEMINASYENFNHPSVTPLKEIESDHFVLELFHGPTLAFKDVAMQFLARLIDDILVKRSRRATIIGATSGDTGSAAIEAFKGRDNVDIFILHPLGRTSEIQRKQMTSVIEDNVFNIAIEGNFDDCQNIVKALFADEKFRQTTNLSGVNSINWGRILAQITYYFKAASDLGAPHKQIDFTVPTGNFGDIFAGFAAKKMGLPIRKLIIATNENDILARTLKTGRYETNTVQATSSPSMDIQISSNFERLLFEALNRDGAKVRALMNSLKQSGSFSLPKDALDYIKQDFLALSANQSAVDATMASTLKKSNYLLDPHSAVAVNVAQALKDKHISMISLATAHPAKFPKAVEKATGQSPQLPDFLSDLLQRKEKMQILQNDVSEIKQYINQHTRVNK